MRHEEENNWHPSDRRRHTDRREASRHREDENFNDFGSRWGEPDPRLSPRHQENNNNRDSRNPREDWRPFERQIEQQHRQNQRYDHSRHEHHEPAWRQRDRHFNSDNQHANDRWQNNGNMPDPDQHERRHHNDEQRRRSFRDDSVDRY